jgi:phosphatidylserine/phosphatidylglycerophosphate/cardiolipin synthase-like enzyme
MTALSPRSYQCLTAASSWEEIWEAGPYYDQLSELLEDAQRYAIISGWQIDSRLPMQGPRGRETLQQKILRICYEKPAFQFYILMWDHAYFYAAERELWQGRVWDLRHPRVHFIFDNRHPLGGAHHEKTVILDGTVALTGGIDLCDERWDTPQHRYFDLRRSLSGTEDPHGPYHDLSVKLTGPICRILHKNLALRWQALSSISLPPPAPLPAGQKYEPGPGDQALYVSRTTVDVDASVKMVREIEFLFRDLVRLAERRIVIEGQYFWSQKITDILTGKMRAMRGKPFELVIILAELAACQSLTSKMALYENLLLERLYFAAEQSGTKLTMGMPYVHAEPAAEPRAIYVHSKLLLIDDRFFCTGSANLNSRGMRIDTEVNLTFEARTPAQRARLRRLRREILGHWGLDRAKPQGPIRVHPFIPSARTHQNEVRRYPYARLFDPLLPWGYAAKRRVLQISRRKPLIIAAGLAGLTIMATFAVLLLSSAPTGWSWFYAALLASSWLFPVPFFFTALVASLHLGGHAGAPLAVWALWISSLLGYLAGRTFPSFAKLLLGPSLPAVHNCLGRRTFQSLIGKLADPRSSFRTKVLAQGLYFMPLPWFLLSMGLLMPSACWTCLRWSDHAVPRTLVFALRGNPAATAALILFWTAISGLRETAATAHQAQAAAAKLSQRKAQADAA